MSEPVLDILDRLIAFDTVSAKSNLPLIDYVQDFLQQRGFETHRFADETGLKAGLYASLGPANDGILLSAHSDVVPVDGQTWTMDPFRLTAEDGKLYGRGTCDMKGYLAAMLACADKAAGLRLAAPLKLSISYDEEVGCVGIQQMKNHLAPLLGTPRMCFVGEPTQMQVAIGHKGKAAYRAVCHGSEGHSAMAPMFANALHVALDFGQALRDLQQDYASAEPQDAAYDIPHATVHLGKMSGGRALNMIPDTAVLDFEFRYLATDSRAAFDKKLASRASDIAARHQELSTQASIEIEAVMSYPGLALDPDHSAIDFAKSLCSAKDTIKVSFGTEAGVFAEMGVPTVVCGPGSMQNQGHKPDEYLELSQLRQCQNMLEGILRDLET
ncbi:MAG: acetylornithine deacetylase [Pseudomonadota bacterium]